MIYLDPLFPFGPFGPNGPGSPFSPLTPGSPLDPGKPRFPGSPEIQKQNVCLLKDGYALSAGVKPLYVPNMVTCETGK